MENNIVLQGSDCPDIPVEKFKPAVRQDLAHDKKLDTKPIGYFKGAFIRFCKNKGSVVAACIILLLILFAIFVPIFTPYTVSYYDNNYVNALPRNRLFEKTSFWDGCEEVKNVGLINFTIDYAKGQETGYNAIKDQKYTENDGSYTYRQDSIHKVGCIYQNVSAEEFADIQKYQDETGKQVIYPTVDPQDRPKNQDGKNANYYFKTEIGRGGKTQIVFDEEGKIIPVYWEYEAGTVDDGYTSKKRIEGESGFERDGKTYFYRYSNIAGSGYEIRINYYEYYIYRHTYVNKDGIKAPYFLFGCEKQGKDILTCLASGARFSFLFAIAVAVVNMIVGAIYGSIAGYYGGKADLIMERISDILSAIPMMIVITLLKLHMGGSSHVLVLFLSFFLTGWIGMAGTTRMQFYRYKNQEYVLAARTLGAKDKRLMFKHIFPNAIGTLVTSCALVIPSMIYSEINLSYLGIINLSTGDITSVGTLINAGQSAMSQFPHAVAIPVVYLVLLMLSFNLFGNGLRDAFNPSLRGTEG